ncbi:MAG: ABC transporter permease subunit [Planctomycetota bacterium]|nr:ABC transporter permease subunit [Planctomycetota bacterium]MDA1211553.1 ABC transporter permease subunit [Planctomycetota bacterium]
MPSVDLLPVLAQISSQATDMGYWLWPIIVTSVLLIAWTVVEFTTRIGIISRGTTKEAIRQPIFLLLMAIAIILLVVNTFVPFFSMGDDIKMHKDCGLATILITGLLLAVWTSSTSIADEIEGKTAMTVLSKPINRRQFIVGKYLGILKAVLFMMIPVVIVFMLTIPYKVGYDAKESSLPDPTTVDRMASLLQIVPGIILIFFEIAILSAVSVAISTRLPMVVNIVTCFSVFVVGHLTPVLVGEGVLKNEFVSFMARLISTALPNLDSFNMQTAVATGVMVPPVYLGNAALYCGVYSLAAILLAFILFEERDLA